ncbi:hypothetical protein LOH53_13805 [Arthrobacter cryoconiti]|nr:hypothetical protein [Arthrobacter cryoconiti]
MAIGHGLAPVFPLSAGEESNDERWRLPLLVRPLALRVVTWRMRREPIGATP